jgi:hypothetical protein
MVRVMKIVDEALLQRVHEHAAAASPSLSPPTG